MRSTALTFSLGFILAACGPTTPPASTPTTAPTTEASSSAAPATELPVPVSPMVGLLPTVPATPTAHCGAGGKLRVRFFDVSQALSALVELPDGRRILVDTGDSPTRAGCGAVCVEAHKNLLSKLDAALGGRPIDLLWITHQHSDHMGGAKDILAKFKVNAYVDNGLSIDDGEIKKLRDLVVAKGVPITVVEPGHESIPLPSTADVKITGIAPSMQLPKCTTTDRNLCSNLLRIDYCSTSVLLTGDAEVAEESLLDPRGSATLLQVGHHGSVTSSGAAFLETVKPKYAVVSAGKPDEGENKGYCHPARSTIEHLNAALGGAGTQKVSAYTGTSCEKGVSHLAGFVEVATSDRLWATERDGDVVLVTTGDGSFTRE